MGECSSPAPAPFAILMAGGRGTRFWPKSRRAYPKQFLPLLDHSDPLLKSTVDRISPVVPLENVYVVSHVGSRNKVLDIVPGIDRDHIFEEPFSRNTAPCIALASLHLLYSRQADLNDVCVVLPSDHYVGNSSVFLNVIETALWAASEYESIVTIGIEPTRAEEGYGYIQAGEKISLQREGFSEIARVENFLEKPSRKHAEELIAKGGHYWNAGLFVFTLSTVLDLFESHLPDLFSSLNPVIKKHGSVTKALESGELDEIYASIASESFDTGIMEKVKNVLVVAADMDWSDVGDWRSIYEMTQKDKEGNACIGGKFVNLDGKNSLIYNEETAKLIATVGVEDIAVVNTKDALLICKLEDVQKVKKMTEVLDEKGLRDLL